MNSKPLRKGIVFSALILLIVFSLLVSGCRVETTTGQSSTTETENTAEPFVDQDEAFVVFDQYVRYWLSQDYAAMYGLLSAQAKSRIAKDAFVDRYTNIFAGIEASRLEIIRQDDYGDTLVLEDEQKTRIISFTLQMDTLAGSLTLPDYRARLIYEETSAGQLWRLDWSEKLIFPTLGPDDKVVAKVLQPARGEIFDRNQRGLAVNGDLISIGIAPGKFAPVAAEAIPQIAEKLGLAPEKIQAVFENATNPEWFYPIVTLPSSAGDLAAELTRIDGVLYQKVPGRVYPGGEAAALVIGYIGPITAQELSELEGKDYTAQDKIGKMGLEQVYEERLRGKKGGEITLVDGESGQLKDIIARLEPENGETIVLNLDIEEQIAVYNSFDGDAGAGIVLDPTTGALTALVSSPSFDPNLLQTYVPAQIQKDWDTTEKNPFLNRFKATYAPGSVFKLITAAIGLSDGSLEPEEAVAIKGKQWQKDASWGDYYVTRVKEIDQAISLRQALIYSDNIFFAQLALRIGAQDFTAGVQKFGIGEALPLDYPFYLSQLANSGLSSEILLADSGYGQGEVMVTPLDMALAYGALATQGDIYKPVLEKTGQPADIWKKGAIEGQFVELLSSILLENVENPEGTGYTKTPGAVRILGKTGTAELKKDLEDTQAQENGWFVGLNLSDPRRVIALVVEDVKGRGGSHYVVGKVKQSFDAIIAP